MDGAPRLRRPHTRCAVVAAWAGVVLTGAGRSLAPVDDEAAADGDAPVERNQGRGAAATEEEPPREADGTIWMSLESRDDVRRGEAVAAASLAEVRGDRALIERGHGRTVAAARVRPEEVEEFKALNSSTPG